MEEIHQVENTKKGRYFKVIGIAMHLIGDVYAHRTMVPASVVEGTFDTSKKIEDQQKFNPEHFKRDKCVNGNCNHEKPDEAKLRAWAKNPYESNICKRWKWTKQTVELGVMEFLDVKYYMGPAVEVEDRNGMIMMVFICSGGMIQM